MQLMYNRHVLISIRIFIEATLSLIHYGSLIPHVHTREPLSQSLSPCRNSFQQYSSLLDFAGFQEASLKSVAERKMAYLAVDFAFDDRKRRRFLFFLRTPL